MELQSFEAVMGALDDAGVRSILVGGMAVVSHGHGRMTSRIPRSGAPGSRSRA